MPPHLYSFSFAPNQRWTRPYPQQQEVQDYILRVVDDFALRPLIRFNTEVVAMRWLLPQQCWQIEIVGQDAPLLARHVVLATGPLNKLMIPDVPGLQSFAGESFHSSHWRQDVAMQGKRVAVVGTGASAVQFVPEIAPAAAQVTVFQRTPAWVLPRWDKPYGAIKRWAYRHVPMLQRLSRWRVYWFNEFVGMGFMGSTAMQGMLKRLANHHLRSQVVDAEMRKALTPNFNPGCKRLLISNTWFPALQRPNVQLVTQAVGGISPTGVVGADGTLYPCDVIIWGTGFKATEFVAPMRIYGAASVGAGQGDAPELGAVWRSKPAASHLGITVAGFPNLFLLVGPNTGLGHNSIIFMIECQVDYIVRALGSLRDRKQTVRGRRCCVRSAPTGWAGTGPQRRFACQVGPAPTQPVGAAGVVGAVILRWQIHFFWAAMQVVSATVEDARLIAEIHVATWRAAYVGIVSADFLAGLSVDQREAYWRQEIPLGKQQVALATLGDAVLGWVSYGPSRDADALPAAAEIWAIYVAPEHWSTGAGRQLWVHARAQLVQQGFQSVSLWVLANNWRAMDFYGKAGFEPDIASTKQFTLGGATLTEVRYIAPL